MVHWQDLRIDPERLRADLEELARIGRDADGALTRLAFSPAYEQARSWLKSRLEAADIPHRDDAAGNSIGRVGAADTPCVISGSHIDTVPDGGPLDGAYGVLSAVEVARVLVESRLELPRAFECVAFVDEEGHFFDGLGSKAMCGALSADDVRAARSAGGDSLAGAMTRAGFDADDVLDAARGPNEIDSYVELHIEQGPVLESIGVPIGNVEAIVGTSNLWITFSGDANHSGTTPMDLRRDAYSGAAEFCYRARQMVLDRGTPGRVRLTYGIVEVHPKAHNIIPDRVRMHQEIREIDDALKLRLSEATIALARDVAKEHRLEVAFERVPEARAARMSDRVRTAIAESANELELAVHDMPSGAVHDAQNLARLTDAGMIFVPSTGGRSHRRDEATDWRFLEHGANVLLQTVLRLIHE